MSEHVKSLERFAIDADTITRDERIRRYYENAGPDYEAWSNAFNMHFGYWRPGVNPLNLESMLEETNRQVLDRLMSPPEQCSSVIDLGCGLGATMRSGARRSRNKIFTGVTLVSWQVTQGRQMAQAEGLGDRVAFECADFHRLPFADETFDGCYAIEAIVHGEGPSKRQVAREAFRVLKPGSRFVIFDCFLKHPPEKMSLLVRHAYQQACEGWAVKEMPQIELFREALAREGFTNISCEDISWHVAPSVAHVPYVTVTFLLSKLAQRKRLSRDSVQHVKACALSCLLGLARPTFSYFIVSAEK